MSSSGPVGSKTVFYSMVVGLWIAGKDYIVC